MVLGGCGLSAYRLPVVAGLNFLSVTLPTSHDNEDEIYRAAVKLMQTVRKPNQAVRLLGVGVSGIGAPVRQLSLRDVGTEKSRKLQEVVDELQAKYGKSVIHKGEG